MSLLLTMAVVGLSTVDAEDGHRSSYYKDGEIHVNVHATSSRSRSSQATLCASPPGSTTATGIPPIPTKTVRWGSQTFDEMHLGYVEYYIPGAKPGDSTSLNSGRRGLGRNLTGEANGRPGFDLEAIFKRLDRNNDGKLIGDEIPEAQRENLMRLDVDKDGAITLEEAKKLRR